jgi:hypothetical protein
MVHETPSLAFVKAGVFVLKVARHAPFFEGIRPEEEDKDEAL